MGGVILTDRTLLVAVTCGVAALGCQKTERTTPLGALACADCNLLLISLTNVRKDHLSAYGYDRETSPNIARRFVDSFRFQRAYSTASWTLPATASVYTSRYPYEHGAMMRYKGLRLDDDETTLAEVLRQGGYRTIGITGGGDHNRKYNIAQGFDLYVDERNYASLGIHTNIDLRIRMGAAYLGIEQLVPVAIRWLETNADRKFFMVFNGFDAHCPFQPRPPFDTRFDSDYAGGVDFSPCLWTFEPVEPVVSKGERRWPVRTSVTSQGVADVTITDRDVTHMLALYDGEIAQADHDLERLLATFERLGLMDKTIIVFFSEHGDLFGEHGRFMRGGPHRGTFYEPVINVPLMVRHPRVNGGDVNGLVSLVDLMPTLLDLLQVEDPERASRRGRSLVPMLLDPQVALNEHVYAASAFVPCKNPYFNTVSASEVIRGPRFKLMVETMGGQTETTLYDLDADPGEEGDIAAERPEVAGRMKASVEDFFAASRADRWRSKCP